MATLCPPPHKKDTQPIDGGAGTLLAIRQLSEMPTGAGALHEMEPRPASPAIATTRNDYSNTYNNQLKANDYASKMSPCLSLESLGVLRKWK
jgi:hypothetical protein